MSDWSKDIDLEVIKEYLRECAKNDDYYYEQYQIDIIMHEYIRQNKEIERLNNIINELENYLNKVIETSTEQEKITCSFVLQYLQELKGSDK